MPTTPKFCPKGHKLSYSTLYDAKYCRICNQWTEIASRDRPPAPKPYQRHP